VERIEGGPDGRVAAVVTSDGRRIAADLVIVGVGAVPNTELAAAAGLTIANGIGVDGQMRSSVPEILAIGDAASYRHWQSGTDIRLESVQNATDQARLAARTVTGHADPYASVPWFWSDIGDMKLQMVGLPGLGDSTLVTGEPDGNRFSILHYRAGRLTAIESVNRPADHMLGRKMLAAGFSPSLEEASSGELKEAFARWQAAR
jgi:3-phenylpropionate/trans-cinnamate dioxygenase ferredoxin reductase subunit